MDHHKVSRAGHSRTEESRERPVRHPIVLDLIIVVIVVEEITDFSWFLLLPSETF
jgi:hypothetical protein